LWLSNIFQIVQKYKKNYNFELSSLKNIAYKVLLRLVFLHIKNNLQKGFFSEHFLSF